MIKICPGKGLFRIYFGAIIDDQKTGKTLSNLKLFIIGDWDITSVLEDIP